APAAVAAQVVGRGARLPAAGAGPDAPLAKEAWGATQAWTVQTPRGEAAPSIDFAPSRSLPVSAGARETISIAAKARRSEGREMQPRRPASRFATWRSPLFARERPDELRRTFSRTAKCLWPLPSKKRRAARRKTGRGHPREAYKCVASTRHCTSRHSHPLTAVHQHH